MWAQVVLLAAVAGIFLYFVSRKHNVRMQAGKRIGFFGFLAFAVYAVLFPQHVTLLAHALGIGRGADLLLYMLVVAFLFGMLNTYLRFRGTTQQITELARTLAIREAELVNHQRGVMGGEQVHSPVAATTAAATDYEPAVAEQEAGDKSATVVGSAAESPATSTATSPTDTASTEAVSTEAVSTETVSTEAASTEAVSNEAASTEAVSADTTPTDTASAEVSSSNTTANTDSVTTADHH